MKAALLAPTLKDHDQPTYYEIFDVRETASTEAVEAVYRSAAEIAHPDHGGSPGYFRLLTRVRDTLINPKMRAIYDDGRGTGGTGTTETLTAQGFWWA